MDWEGIEEKQVESPLIDIISEVIDYDMPVKPREVNQVDLHESNGSKMETIQNWSTHVIKEQ